MREILSEREMIGPINFEVYTMKLSLRDNELLCTHLKKVPGVASVKWKGRYSGNEREGFVVSVEASRMQYFAAIHDEVINVAHAFQTAL